VEEASAAEATGGKAVEVLRVLLPYAGIFSFNGQIIMRWKINSFISVRLPRSKFDPNLNRGKRILIYENILYILYVILSVMVFKFLHVKKHVYSKISVPLHNHMP
jgi:hypothetical protein